MKKLVQLSLAVLFMILLSCEKKEQNIESESQSEYEQVKEFKREVVVSDESGENSVFLVIYSDYKEAIGEYLNNTKLSIIIEDKDLINNMNSDTLLNNRKSLNSEMVEPDIDERHHVEIEIVRENLNKNVEVYSLHIESKNLKSTNGWSSQTEFIKHTGNFIGVVHLGKGYSILAYGYYKEKWYNGWTKVFGTILNGTSRYWGFVDTYDTYKTAILVYHDTRQSSKNYKIVKSKDNFYSHDCEIGTYDYNNYGECYVGTSPTGTHAFVYGAASWGHQNFYYTPYSSSNKCPRAGSWFDGANCYVMRIPDGCVAYTWKRNWLVKSKKLNTNW